MAGVLTFSVSREIDASIDDVWAVLGDFGNEHRWTSTVADCARDTAEVRVGTVRHCRLPKPLMGRREVRETVVAVREGEMLSYELDGPAGPFARSRAQWSVAGTDAQRSRVTVQGRFVPRHPSVRFVWPALAPMLRRLSRSVLRELDGYVVASRAT